MAYARGTVGDAWSVSVRAEAARATATATGAQRTQRRGQGPRRTAICVLLHRAQTPRPELNLHERGLPQHPQPRTRASLTE
eukprot:7380026-Prymnesium_polylepis.2